MKLNTLTRLGLAPFALAAALTLSSIAPAFAADVNSGSLSDHDCDKSEWHFVITKFSGSSYPTVNVTWSNGATASLSVDQVSPPEGGKVTLHYRSYANLGAGITVTAASANINGDYQAFNLSHGPDACSPAGEVPFAPAFAYPAVAAAAFGAAYATRRIRGQRA